MYPGVIQSFNIANRNPTVSVVIPTYNRATLITDAILSVLSQSYEDFELIIVDDGSDDNTDEVVNAFNDERLIFIKQENKGRSAARNRAIALSKGKYIAFLDSDDIYLADKLKLQVAYMDANSDVGMVYTSAICIDQKNNLLNGHAYEARAEGNIYQDVAFFCPVTITLPTVMVPKAVLNTVGCFDEAMERFEDTDLWRRIAKHYRVGVIVAPTCQLKTHEDNALRAQDPNKIIKAIDYYVSKIFREDKDVGAKVLKYGASCFYEYYGRAFLTIPHWRGYGAQMLVKSIVFVPKRGVKVLLVGFKTYIGALMRQWLRISS